MIKIAKDFQNSVNISYDLNDERKIGNFIPTTEAINLFEEFFESTHESSVKRAHILIGAYGKGKSHIILEILNILSGKDKNLFSRFFSKIKEQNHGLFDDVNNYFIAGKKLLPVIINASSTSLSQSFLFSLYQTLRQNGFENLMPETNFTAAINTINMWKKEFPETYSTFGKKINIKISDYIEELKNFNTEIYADFTALYPQLTSGSEFNPFLGFDITELYEKVTEKLIESSVYSGIFVVYDEFSKYLESSISKAGINDIKLLQDFAEKCCRSGKNQMHLLLISHKEISNYIDILPKEKVDGWKGVSERFIHLHMNSDYSKIYEIMAETIIKENDEWNKFLEENKGSFENVSSTKAFKSLFPRISEPEIKIITEGCWPLHPATSYILPRLSEKAAQNERTMFTFLSADEKNTLASFLKHNVYKQNGKILFVTPDILFDYFENSLRAEPYTSPIKSIYRMAKTVLSALSEIQAAYENLLPAKIIKTLSLIYILNQFERLPPTAEILHAIYSDAGFSFKEITNALDFLITKENFIYSRRSNNFLQLKERSKVNIEELILNTVEKRKNKISDAEILNSLNPENFLYPVEYNVKTEMTRYFQFLFIEEKDFLSAASITQFESKSEADGIVLGIIPSTSDDEENIKKLNLYVEEKSSNAKFSVFVLPEKLTSITQDLRKIDAVSVLKKEYENDSVLCSEFSLIEQDLEEVILNFIRSYTHPEFAKSIYYAVGKCYHLFRKASLSHLLSKLCEEEYTMTPVINNEPLNKKELTAAARKSRAILIDAILNSDEANLGITGGQELSFKRSALCVPGILSENGNSKYFDIKSDSLSPCFKNLFTKIEEFIEKAKQKECSFEILINELTNKYFHIAMRKGTIPIFIAVSFSRILNNIVLKEEKTEVKVNAASICSAVENPEKYFLKVISWSKDKEIYIEKLEKLFEEYIFVNPHKKKIGYTYILNGITDWFRELPKYAKETERPAPAGYKEFLSIIKNGEIGAQEILFDKTKEIFASDDYVNDIFHKIEGFKFYYEKVLNVLEEELVETTKNALGMQNVKISLCECGRKFFDSLDKEGISEHKFENHAENLYKAFFSCGNNDHKLVKTLAITLTGINTSDWSEQTKVIFEKQLEEFILTLKNFDSTRLKNGIQLPTTENHISHNTEEFQNSTEQGTYFLQYVDEKGKTVRRNFSKTSCSARANSLKTEISNILTEYGLSVSESEKRQVILKILEELSE